MTEFGAELIFCEYVRHILQPLAETVRHKQDWLEQAIDSAVSRTSSYAALSIAAPIDRYTTEGEPDLKASKQVIVDDDDGATLGVNPTASF